MRFVGPDIEFEAMPDQVLLQRAGQLRQLLRQVTGRGIHDVIMPPVARVIETQLETLPAHLLRRQLQRLKSGLIDIADEHQRVMQGLAAHRAAAAQSFQRCLPRGQMTAFCGVRPQRKKYPRGRMIGSMAHRTVILSSSLSWSSGAPHSGKMRTLSSLRTS